MLDTSDRLLDPADWNGIPVLVTGGCGFIGSHLVAALGAAGAHVWVLDNLQSGSLDCLSHVEGVKHVEIADVRNAEQVRSVIACCLPRYVFHLAANASVPGSVQDPSYDFETNCMGTFVLLESLRWLATPSRTVLASSGAVYGQPSQFPISEEHPLTPISPYGASKKCAEAVTDMFMRVYGLSAVTARIFNTYGPRMPRFVVLDFLRKLHRNPRLLEVLGDGHQVRDFTFVSDTIRGLAAVACRGSTGEAYNISSGVSVTVLELAEMLVRHLGLAGQTRIVCSGQSWPGDAQRWEVSIAKVEALGFKPEVPLAEGLRRTIAWFDDSLGSASAKPVGQGAKS